MRVCMVAEPLNDPDSFCARSKCLSRAGFKVELACDGVEALEVLQRRQTEQPGQPPVDIILLDLFMPRMNGKELLIRLKQSNEVRPLMWLCL